MRDMGQSCLNKKQLESLIRDEESYIEDMENNIKTWKEKLEDMDDDAAESLTESTIHTTKIMKSRISDRKETLENILYNMNEGEELCLIDVDKWKEIEGGG